MRTKKQLAKYFRKHVNAVKELTEKANEQFTAEDFHQLRVEIKKIRAFVVMLKSSAMKFNPNIVIKPIKKIFDQAGKVRQIQLEEEALKKYDPDRTLQLFPHTLHLKEQEEKNNFAAIQHRFKKKIRRVVNHIVPVIKESNIHDIKKYIKDTKKELGDLLSKETLETKQVHELRKGLKKLYYNLKSLKLAYKSIVFKNGRTLQELMGQWHDTRVMARDFLKATRKRIIAPTETEEILKIASQLDAKSLQLYKKIDVSRARKAF